METSKKKIILSIFITFIMVASIGGYIFAPESATNKEKKYYKGLEFAKEGDLWVTEINGNKVSVFADPGMLSDSNIVNLRDINSAQKIYLAINPKDNLKIIFYELNTLAGFLKPKLITACYSESDECKTMTLRTCDDATSINKVIMIKIQNETKIDYENNCLELIGTENEIVKFIDNLIIENIANE